MRIAPLLPLAFTLSACNDKADPAADTDLPIDADADADANGDADSDASWPSINPDSVHHCPLSRQRFAIRAKPARSGRPDGYALLSSAKSSSEVSFES